LPVGVTSLGAAGDLGAEVTASTGLAAVPFGASVAAGASTADGAGSRAARVAAGLPNVVEREAEATGRGRAVMLPPG
jgi:hypothetical protein